MLSKAKEKYIRSLHQKKFRQIESKFIVEGIKTINELLQLGYFPAELYLQEGVELSQKFPFVEYCSDSKIKSISQLSNPDGAIAIYKNSTFDSTFNGTLNDKIVLVLNEMNDPGNLGTIMRTAAWFGINHILLTENSVDIYNSKTLQAAKSSFAHVKSTYHNELDIFNLLKKNDYSIVVAHTDGKDAFEHNVNKKTALILGNEARGLSQFWINAADDQIAIKKIGEGESLNVAISAAILMAACVRAF
jgi:TrmH family RNA methyltransferase